MIFKSSFTVKGSIEFSNSGPKPKVNLNFDYGQDLYKDQTVKLPFVYRFNKKVFYVYK